MKSIKQLKSILPITYDDKLLRLINSYDIQWYTNNCRKEYYERYMDFKFSTDITIERLQNLLSKMAYEYVCNIESNNEARILLCSGDEIIGGITVYEREIDIIELGYFVIPEYSSKGIGFHMLDTFISRLISSNIQFSKIRFIIREDNIASIKLAEKLGFQLTKKFIGKYKYNLEYTLDRYI